MVLIILPGVYATTGQFLNYLFECEAILCYGPPPSSSVQGVAIQLDISPPSFLLKIRKYPFNVG